MSKVHEKILHPNIEASDPYSKLTKRQFMKMFAVLGLQPMLSACGGSKQSEEVSGASSTSPVLIIGAGAAGLAAGYRLMQSGVKFQILEAAPTYGGRMKRTTTFTDFPIPLGAEWLHTAKTELGEIANDLDVETAIQTQGYSPQDSYGYFEDGELTVDALGDFDDIKFINSTWFDFFETFIVPPLRTKIRFDTQATTINYQDDKVVVTDQNGNNYQAEKVIVTAPLKILQDGDIRFVPTLPTDKTTAIGNAVVWGGIKVFLEFSEQFYPTFLETPDSDTSLGQQAYYDAAYGQDTNTNILGLFAVGKQAEPYQDLSGEALRDYILAELDAMFEGAASQGYIKHTVQNWNEEPFIRSAYLANNAPASISHTLSQPVAGKLFFAGDAYTQENDWGAVHNATRSARDAVQEIVG